MVFAVRCPATRCRKFMLVEDDSRGKTIACLICKTPIRVPSGDIPPPAPAEVPAPVPAPLPPPPPPAKVPELPLAAPIHATLIDDSDFELIPDDRP